MVPNTTWSYLQNCLQNDLRPGALFLGRHLAELKNTIATGNGQVLRITAENNSTQTLALVGLTCACHSVHLHFIHVLPGVSNSLIIDKLRLFINAAGKEVCYGYVFVHCTDFMDNPEISNIFIEMAIDKADEVRTSGAKTVVYIIPKKDWEKFPQQ